jgi:hypothetical protein
VRVEWARDYAEAISRRILVWSLKCGSIGRLDKSSDILV